MNFSTILAVYTLRIVVCTSAFAEVRYIITDLGTLGGHSSLANAISENGQVAGGALTAAGYEHAFLYSNRVMTDLGHPRSAESQPYDA